MAVQIETEMVQPVKPEMKLEMDVVKQETQHVEDADAVSMEEYMRIEASKGRQGQTVLSEAPRAAVIAHAEALATAANADRELMVRAALLAQTGDSGDLADDEKQAVASETTTKWKQAAMLYYQSIMCAMCAVVQGMDETVINGAQLYLENGVGLDHRRPWIEGLVVGAPYLSCAVLGCALTGPLNRALGGRRGAIFAASIVSAGAALWQAFARSWPQLLAARLLLGIGIGPNSATVPVYAAECAPAPIRGALVMMWQLWTAFGIMLGYVACVVFRPSAGITEDLAWRLMLGSTVLFPLLVCAQIFLVPESPQWLVNRRRLAQAYQSFCRLRSSSVVAARDLYLMETARMASSPFSSHPTHPTQSRSFVASHFRAWLASIRSLLTRRNRRALYASGVLMVMQQFCGVNVIAYYSSTIFLSAGLSQNRAHLASLGFGIINFVFALPAIRIIDTKGRRFLALFTLPLLAVCLAATAIAFSTSPSAPGHVAGIAVCIYVFAAIYSVGMGPVPFTYSAEAFGASARDSGMSVATTILWACNFILSLTWPALLARLSATGAFSYYAAWNVAGFLLVFLFVPETKGLSLSGLDELFSVSTLEFVASVFRRSRS